MRRLAHGDFDSPWKDENMGGIARSFKQEYADKSLWEGLADREERLRIYERLYGIKLQAVQRLRD